MIYVNTDIPIEELSKIQKHIELSRKIKVQTEYLERNKERYKTNHTIWSKNNKDHLAVYREDNRVKITEQYKKHMRARLK